MSSQTLENMQTIAAATPMLVLRPLVGMDKAEIIAQAERIGTFATSILPDQDCCSLFVPPHPTTHATAAEVAAAESLLDVAALVHRGIEAAERERFVYPHRRSARGTESSMTSERIQDLLELLEDEPDDALLQPHARPGVSRRRRRGVGAAASRDASSRVDPRYTVAYRYLGTALERLERSADAADVWERGIAVAEETGDIQAGKEMRVFLDRLRARGA